MFFQRIKHTPTRADSQLRSKKKEKKVKQFKTPQPLTTSNPIRSTNPTQQYQSSSTILNYLPTHHNVQINQSINQSKKNQKKPQPNCQQYQIQSNPPNQQYQRSSSASSTHQSDPTPDQIETNKKKQKDQNTPTINNIKSNQIHQPNSINHLPTS